MIVLVYPDPPTIAPIEYVGTVQMTSDGHLSVVHPDYSQTMHQPGQWLQVVIQAPTGGRCAPEPAHGAT